MTNNLIDELLCQMDTITLEEMDHVRLMRRRDVKYVVPKSVVHNILGKVAAKYRVLDIDGLRMQDYHTRYYDTPSRHMYHQHHNRRLNRYKIRLRKYTNSNLTFLEIKFKNNRGETIKKRICSEKETSISGISSDIFISENSPYSTGEIYPALLNNFKRITLVHKTSPERLTIDVNLSFSGVDIIDFKEFHGLAVIEIKRDRDAKHSDMISQLRREHYQSMGFSKYCIGTAILMPDVKKNLFRQRIRQVQKLEASFHETTI